MKTEVPRRSVMSVPIDITDPKLVRAYAHPLRMQILGLLDNRTASPSEIAAELGTPLSNTSYHVRQLVALGLIELVSRTARRGAIEHHYTAKVRPTITDAGWARLPDIVKRAVLDGWLQQTIAHVVAAAGEGGFHRDDAHHSRTAGPLDDKGWETVTRELARTLKRVDEALEQSRARLEKDPDARATNATIILMQCEGPSPEAVALRRSAQTSARHGETSEAPNLHLDESVPRRTMT
jgi:DNA-binding transcriptional ArsR family regulator